MSIKRIIHVLGIGSECSDRNWFHYARLLAPLLVLFGVCLLNCCLGCIADSGSQDIFTIPSINADPEMRGGPAASDREN
jgi:hypothetical protein